MSEQVPLSSPQNRDLVRLRCVRQRRRCWRCCQAFFVLVATYELEPYYHFRCGNCGTYRVLPADEVDQLVDAYDAMCYKLTQRKPLRSQKQFNRFLNYLIRHWVPPCECGGKYYHGGTDPARCPNCRARSFPFFPWSDDVIQSDPLKKLPILAGIPGTG